MHPCMAGGQASGQRCALHRMPALGPGAGGPQACRRKGALAEYLVEGFSSRRFSAWLPGSRRPCACQPLAEKPFKGLSPTPSDPAPTGCPLCRCLQIGRACAADPNAAEEQCSSAALQVGLATDDAGSARGMFSRMLWCIVDVQRCGGSVHQSKRGINSPLVRVASGSKQGHQRGNAAGMSSQRERGI